jgi:hypothetical protein
MVEKGPEIVLRLRQSLISREPIEACSLVKVLRQTVPTILVEDGKVTLAPSLPALSSGTEGVDVIRHHVS